MNTFLEFISDSVDPDGDEELLHEWTCVSGPWESNGVLSTEPSFDLEATCDVGTVATFRLAVVTTSGTRSDSTTVDITCISADQPQLSMM